MEPFRITADLSERTLHVSVFAHWNDATAHRFATELETAAMALKRIAKRSYWLIDTGGAPPQSQATTLMLQDTIARVTQHNENYVAVIAPSALVARQARRVGPDRLAVFSERASAEAWLAERRGEEGAIP